MSEETLEQIAALAAMSLAELVHLTGQLSEQLMAWLDDGAPGDPDALMHAKASAEAFLDNIPTIHHQDAAIFQDIVAFNVAAIIQLISDGLTIQVLKSEQTARRP